MAATSPSALPARALIPTVLSATPQAPLLALAGTARRQANPYCQLGLKLLLRHHPLVHIAPNHFASQGYFHNATTGGCSACSSGCARCNSATQCSRCINRSDRVINGVCTTCAATTGDANCVSCTSNGLTCTGCKEGYTRDPSTGVVSAGDGYSS